MMYPPFPLQVFALIAISLIYASFDLFNKRNVPDAFAYASVAAGVLITLTFNESTMAYSFAIALFVGSVGYLIYRLGMWGAGDCFELVAISLIMPIQPLPLLDSVIQLELPFVLSVFVATGFATVFIVPIYYLVFAKKTDIERKPEKKHLNYGMSLLLLYLLLFITIYYFYSFDLVKIILIILVAVPSAITVMFENDITTRMVEKVYPNELEEGDIVAFNMMSSDEMRYFLKYKNFGRLVTKEMMKGIKTAKRKLPVYKNAAPLALFIVIGVIISLLLGNVILLIV
jgi:hypothetical protein